MSERNEKGSCGCGKIGFESVVDLEKPTYKCNCSVCTKARFWAIAAVPGTFRILKGETNLTIYRGLNAGVSHNFCRYCGIKIFGDVLVAQKPVVLINIAAFDSISAEQLSNLKIQYSDGRQNRWDLIPAVTSHL